MMFKFWKKDSASEAYFEKFQSILTRMEAAMSDSVHSGSISCLILVQFLPYQQAALEAAQNVLLHTEEERMWRFASQIVAEQKANIESMQAMLCACTRLENSRQARHRYQRQMVEILQDVVPRMRRTGAVRRVACHFLRYMALHETGTMKMAVTAMQYEICPELMLLLQAAAKEERRLQIEELSFVWGCSGRA